MTERRALVLTDEAVQATVKASHDSPRLRMIQPFHRSEQDTLHRMLNAVQPDSYIRPHRHVDPPKAEAWIVLRGTVVFFTFEEDGAIRDCIELRASGPAFGVDLVPGVFHTFLAKEPDTVVYEVKTGPYSATSDKAFASFAPPEGTPEARRYLEHLRHENALRPRGGPKPPFQREEQSKIAFGFVSSRFAAPEPESK